MNMNKLQNKSRAVTIVIFSTIIGAFGQVLWKIASDSFSFSLQGILFNIPLISGFVAHGMQLLLLAIALRDADLTVLYPVISLGVIWVFFLSLLFFHETIILENWIGVFAIIAGVVFITRFEK